MLLRSNDSLWFCFSINRFFSACICPQRPQAKGTYLPSMHLDSWDSHPPCGSHTDAPIGCDGSRLCYRFNARPVAGHKYHYPICLSWPSSRIAPFGQSPEDLERLLSVGSFGCSLLWLALSDSRRKVKGMLIFNFQGSQGKADFYPLTYVKEVFLHE